MLFKQIIAYKILSITVLYKQGETHYKHFFKSTGNLQYSLIFFNQSLTDLELDALRTLTMIIQSIN